MLLVLIVVYIVIIIMEVPALIKNGWRRELLIFSLVFVLGVYLSLAQYYRWPLANPLQSMIQSASQWIDI